MDRKDVVIIGGGPAGYAAAIRVSQLGGRATLVERDLPGGTCLNRGCIPVRALVRAAELIDLGKSAREYGVDYAEACIDFTRMTARKDTIVKTVVSGVKLLLEGNGVEVINGTARLLASGEVEVTPAGGAPVGIAARRTIIATGSRCDPPQGMEGRVITTDEALAFKAAPGSMMIMGGGFVGLAFATIFSRLGTRVTVAEKSARLLTEVDGEIVSVLEKELKKNRVQIYTGATVTFSNGAAQNSIGVSVKGEKVDIRADVVLIAEDRKPNVEGLGLERAGVRLNGRGGIEVNRRMETGVAGVFAAGDVTMENMWTHVAYAGGIVAAENAMGMSSVMDYSVVPFCANTIPEIAGVGLTEEQAIAHGHRIKVGRFPFAANATATIMGQRTGMIKIITEEKYGQILGAHVVGPQASNLISEVALAMKLEATPKDIGLLMHGHPTLSEVCWEAARDVSGETIHFVSANR